MMLVRSRLLVTVPLSRRSRPRAWRSAYYPQRPAAGNAARRHTAQIARRLGVGARPQFLSLKFQVAADELAKRIASLGTPCFLLRSRVLPECYLGVRILGQGPSLPQRQAG